MERHQRDLEEESHEEEDHGHDLQWATVEHHWDIVEVEGTGSTVQQRESVE